MRTLRPARFSDRTDALAGVLLLAAGLRVAAFLTLPGFFGPGDPAIYFAMARGCAREGAPWIGFVWHFLTWPDAIRHIEDYYEPGFAYLLAPPLLIGGGSVTAARCLSLLCGI